MTRADLTTEAWRRQRVRVLDRDGWICTACGKAVEGDDATVDHIEAHANAEPGKVWRDDELVSLCRSCNSRKGDRVLIRMPWYSPRWLDSLV